MNTKAIVEISSKIGTPFFLYQKDVLDQNVKRILDSASKYNLDNRLKIYISYFANSNPLLQSYIADTRIGLLLQTEEEWNQLQKYNIKKETVVSPGFLSNEEIDFWVLKNITINLASLDEVKYVINKYPGVQLSFRLDCTFWQNQRTGIKKSEIPELLNLLKSHNKTPYSFHVYTGTGSNLNQMMKSARKTVSLCKKYFPNVKEINFGGGFGFDYMADNTESKHFDWNKYFRFLSDLLDTASIPKDVKIAFEPGRDIFADVGMLVLKAKRIINNTRLLNVATDGSYIYIPSIMKRKRIHQVSFIANGKESSSEMRQGMLSGSTTLSSDYIIPEKVQIPAGIKVGDLIVIKDVGAYGATQHLEFLNKRPAPEVMLNDNDAYVLTERGSMDDRVRYVLPAPRHI